MRGIAHIIGDTFGRAMVAFKAQYDSINPSFDRERRRPYVEMGTQEDYSLTAYDRTQSIANGRDLHQNYAPVKSVLRTVKTHIYGKGPRINLTTDNDEWNTAAAGWFNRWAHQDNCDGAQRWTLTDMNKLSLLGRIREGDIACFFDPAGAVDGTRSGCLYWFEADRIVSMSPGLWKSWLNGEGVVTPAELGVEPESVTQVQGVIKHAKSGRHLAYVVAAKYGLTQVTAKDAFSILPATLTTLIAHPFRISDTRGTADLLGNQADFEDTREIQQNLKARVKNQAALAMVVKGIGAVKKALGRRSNETQPGVTDAAGTAASNYDNLEKVCNGRIEYISKDDDITAFQLAGDSKDSLDLMDRIDAWSSASLGLPDQYTRMKADSSYSAARAITNMAEAEFEVVQDFEENHVLDWQARKALGWAMSNGQLAQGPAGWEASIGWLNWPKPRAIDETKAVSAQLARLSGGLSTYEQELGPEWRKVMEQRRIEKDFVIENGLKVKDVYGPLPVPQQRT